MNLKTALQQTGWNGKLLAHVMGWTPQRITRYKATSSWVIKSKLDAMQAVGVDGVILTWQGASLKNGDPNVIAVEMAFQCSLRNMPFVLLIDPNLAVARPDKTVAPEQEVINQLNNQDIKDVLSAPNYLRDASGKQYVLEFWIGNKFLDAAGKSTFDFTKITSALPNLSILHGGVDYSWPSTSKMQDQLTKDNANPAMKIPAVCGWFFDGGFPNADGTRDYNHEIWTATAPARLISAEGGNAFLDSAALVPKNAAYAGLVTWDDHDEQSAFEQFASAVTGIRIGK